MVERINSATGELFMGCSRYPECAATQPIPLDVQLRAQGQPELWPAETEETGDTA
jgi:ssDNA-binding Zn-finger/Zn-ribbon topoisomerase 1